MRKPVDPRKHGLREPEKVFRKNEVVYIATGDSPKVHLETLIGAWNRILKDIERRGAVERVTDGPHVGGGRHGVSLMYTYEWDNAQYEEEKAAYDAEIAKYEADVQAFIVWETDEAKKVPNLDDKIQRAKERLANLEATRDGLPLPFPQPG